MASERQRPTGLWVEGVVTLRLDGGPARRIERPFALVGRSEGADVRLDDEAVNTRHAYLHLDRRGLFVLDLASARGLRLDGAAAPAGWLGPGGVLEVGGRRIEIVELVVDGRSLPRPVVPPAACLTDAAAAPLAAVVLHAAGMSATPRVLNSELIILGRSSACGISIPGATTERTHAALFRTAAAAFVINLAGWGVWLNGRPVSAAAALADQDDLVISSSRFTVRLQPAGDLECGMGNHDLERPAGFGLSPPRSGGEGFPIPHSPFPIPIPHSEGLALPAELVSGSSQGAVLAWMLGAIQAVQAEMLQRQDAFQRDLAAALRSLHQHQQEALNAHRERVEAIQRELAGLREQLRRLAPGLEARPDPVPTAALPKPKPPRLDDPAGPPADPEAATAWLLERVGRLEAENRSSWRDLLGRLGARS